MICNFWSKGASMKKRISILATVAVVLLFTTTLASAQFANPWVTSYILQNLGPAPAAAVVSYYQPDGTLVSAATKSLTIPTGSSVTVVQYTDDVNLPSGRYSAVISSDQPLAAIANQQTAPTGLSYMDSKPPFGSYSGQGEGATKVIAPEIMHNWYGYYTKMYIQNAGSADATITITFYPGLGGASGVTESAVIMPGAAYQADQKGKTALGGAGGRFNGSAVVTSNQPVVVMVNELNEGAVKLFSYNGFGAGATSVVCPSILRGHYGWYTSIAIANPDTNPADVTITYTADNAFSLPAALRGTTVVKNYTIAPGQSKLRYDGTGASPTMDPSLSDLTTFTRFFGTVKITSNRPIVAKVNQESDSGNAEAYNCIDSSTATTKIAVPLIQSKFYGFFTSLTVQNVSGTAGTVTITYKSDATYSSPPSTTYVKAHPISANGQFNVWEGGSAGDLYSSGIFTRFNGSAIIESTVPVVAIVNEEKGGVSGQDYGYSFNVVNITP
jgi:hypothetical protein